MSSANISAGPLKCLSGEQSFPNHAAWEHKILQFHPFLLNQSSGDIRQVSNRRSTSKVRTFMGSKGVLADPHSLKGLFEG